MNLLERWGFYHITRYCEYEFFKSDFKLTKFSKIIIHLSFLVGFSITLVTASLEIIFFSDLLQILNSPKLLVFFLLTNIGLVLIEFWLLFHLGFMAVAFYINLIGSKSHLSKQLKFSLVRALLELNEPNLQRYGINPYEHKKQYVFQILIYKLKVILSNVVAKLIARKLLARLGLRYYAPLIATLITGFWDAWVQNKVLREARFRLSGRIHANKLLSELEKKSLDEMELESIFRMVSVRFYLYGEFNVNLDYLLMKIASDYALEVQGLSEIQNIDSFFVLFEKLDTKKSLWMKSQLMYLISYKSGKPNEIERQFVKRMKIDDFQIEKIQNKFNNLSI